MTIDQTITLISVVLGSGVISIFIFYNSKKRKANAEASTAEAKALKGFADEWRTIAENRETQLCTSSQKIDSLYADISAWRDKDNANREEVTQLKLDIQQLKHTHCSIKDCKERKPQTGF